MATATKHRTPRETMVEKLYREALERAKKGEPEPGNHHCSNCGRGPDDGVQAFLVLTASGKRESQGELNAMDQYMRNRIGDDLRLVLLCPCCSRDGGCEHTPIKCPVCGLCTNPKGTFASGGPFVRCDGPDVHAMAGVV